MIEDGLEWVVVSGQLGIEIWTAEVVIELKNEFPQLKYSVITPFLDIEKNWNEQRQQQYAYIISQADFVTSITKKPYEAPWQFVEKDKFIIQNTDALLLVYDEEHEGSPKYLKRLVEKYMERNPYELFVITSYDLQIIAEELERAEW
ncbi:SLOG family protein [Ureibacillus thermosphaericus]|uniref:SLOG family protein n=2 Tax=Caryophanaceae TaxID=186818 RepID=UPI001E5E3122|nr:SLOG family protein [Ureibacillus thermosphaericus]